MTRTVFCKKYQRDLEGPYAQGLSPAMIDRLRLTPARVAVWYWARG